MPVLFPGGSGLWRSLHQHPRILHVYLSGWLEDSRRGQVVSRSNRIHFTNKYLEIILVTLPIGWGRATIFFGKPNFYCFFLCNFMVNFGTCISVDIAIGCCYNLLTCFVDIDECSEGTYRCTAAESMCFNTRGSYKCPQVTCPPGFVRAPVGPSRNR